MTDSKPKSMQPQLIALSFLVVALLAIAGNFHFVYGAGLAPRKLDKVSWSLSETIINLDEVRGTPALLIRARYPLFSQVLEQLGDGKN